MKIIIKQPEHHKYLGSMQTEDFTKYKYDINLFSVLGALLNTCFSFESKGLVSDLE